MKILMMILAMSFLGCSYEREIQAEVVIVEIVEMTPNYRMGVEVGCKVTWMDTKNGVRYYSFEDNFCDDFLVGVKYKFLIKR